MVYRLLLFSIFVSVSFAQSYFNRSLGSATIFSSARSMGMANINLIDNSSSSSLYSPSMLASSKSGFSFDIYLTNTSILERRGVNVKDYFGDYLTNADYVVNRNNYNNIFGGIAFGIGSNHFSVSRNIVSSFSYDYTEQVHGRYSLEDDEIGNKDPISGFHNLKISGIMESVSLGYARNGSVVDFGIGYHFIPGASINEMLWIDTLSTNNDNLSSVVAHNNTYDTDSDIKYSLGLNIHYNDRTNLLFSFISKPLSSMSSDNGSYQFIMDEQGIISYTYIDDQGAVNYIDSELSFSSPQIMSIGIEHTPVGINEMILGLELDRYNQEFYYSSISNDTINVKKDRYRFALGVEYMQNNSSFRAGLSYMTRYFDSINPISTFSLGIGKRIDNLQYDIAIQYQLNTYSFPDMFPVISDTGSEFENVNDSSLLLILGIKY